VDVDVCHPHPRDPKVGDDARPGGAARRADGQPPGEVRWKADNYNHLFEQPTLFYAVALVLALVTRDAGTDATLAWTYVGLRAVHSVFQATINKIEVRFALFFVSSLVLAAMTVRAALAVTAA
jgi:hypothetical protein